MTYMYTTPEKIESEIRAKACFGNETVPKLSQVTNWIKEESDTVNALSSRNWGVTTYTDEYVDYDGQTLVALKHSPIKTITKLEYNQARLGSPADWVEKVEEVDFDYYQDTGDLIINFNNWTPRAGRKRLRVTYEAGYENIPLFIQKLVTKMVALRVVNAAVSAGLNEGTTGGSASIGGVNVVSASDIGVGTIRSLQSEVQQLKDELAVGTGVFRYGTWY